MKFIYNLIADIYYTILVFRNQVYSNFADEMDYQQIPIIINNRNRVSFLKMLVDSLQERGYKNIYILDNKSTYPALLDFYKKTDCKVIMLERNIGFDALEKIPLFNQIKKNYFVYTDSDIVPIDECPDDFLNYFLKVLKAYPKIQKVGFSLKFDDLPENFDNKDQVMAWESKFYTESIKEGLFLAPIDTTFALHRPYSCLSTKGRFKMMRVGYPYEAKHMPWYNDSSRLSEEEKYYIEHVEIGTHWSKGIAVENKSLFKRINFGNKHQLK
jgi:hypothetical protein